MRRIRKYRYTKGMKEFDKSFGRHSKIPKCCIQYFVKVWRGSRLHDKIDCDVRDHPLIQYIRCPKCIKLGRSVLIHMCSIDNKSCWKYNDHWLPYIQHYLQLNQP